MTDMVEVIAVDQWSSTGEIETFDYGELVELIQSCGENEVPAIEGGDAGSARAMGISSFAVKEVPDDASPRKGEVWYRETDDGSVEKWKYNYATR